MDETEVQTRISQVIHNFKLLDLHKLDWNADFDSCGIDEYEQTAILTSIEHEFHTVFEDRIFENFRNFNEVLRFVASDHNCF
jgi:acyl carrier protein